MTQRLLAIGECMIELAPDQDDSYRVGFAGDTFNTAWYARQLAPVDVLNIDYFSAVGDDEMSERMVAFMEGAGISFHGSAVQGAGPGLYMIHLKNGERSFQYWRSASAARHLADKLDRLPAVASGDTVYISGITVAILPEARRADLLERLAQFSASGVRVVFDPNLRPHLWRDAASMTQWTMAAAAIADIVLPSFEDEARYFTDKDPNGTAERYINKGAKLVVVKNGPAPVVVRAADGDRFHYQPAIVENVVDTTAAGDAFNAAFLVNYLERGRLRDAVRAGCVLARHVVTRKGALVPVSRTELISEQAQFSA